MISYILAVICGVLVLIADQISKYYIISNFNIGDSCGFLNGFIDIIYINNKGGAWGIFEGKTWTLLSITAFLMIVCLVVLIKYGKKSKLFFWSVNLILFGGLGNMIDRIFRDGNVVDFLHFEFFPQFPIFNIADCVVVCGGGLLIIYFLYDIILERKSKKSAIAEHSDAENE